MSSTIVPPQPLRRETLERPKARFFGFVSLLWSPFCFICLVNLDPGGLLWGFGPVKDDELRTLSWWLVAAEILFILLAVGFWLFEKPRRVVRYVIHDLPGGPVIH